MSNFKSLHHSSSSQPKWVNLWPIALPLSGALISQALLSLVDTALVGHLGGLALASVSIGSYLVFILVAIITGLGTGWHALVSQHAQSQPGILVIGLIYGLLMSVALALIGAYKVADIINLFVFDDRINSLAAYYSQSRLWALPAIVLSIAARIYWSELGKPWQYTKIILVAHLINVPLSYGLIYGAFGLPAMGAVGAGVGTSIALWLGVLLQLILVVRPPIEPLKLNRLLNPTNFLLLLRFTWPPMLQQLIFAIHLAVSLWILSQLGASIMAASFAVLNVGLLLILPAIGLGQSALSLVGTAMANDNRGLALQWSRLIMRAGFLIAILISVFISFISPWLAHVLLVSRELQQLMAAALPWYAMAMVLETMIIIFSRLLLLTGLRKSVLILVSSSQWLVFLPLLAVLAPSYGFMAVWWVHIGYRVLSVLLLWWIWRRNSNGLVMSPKFSLHKAT